MKQVISILFGVCLPLAGQAQSDTTAYALPEVTVTDAHRIREVRAVAPVQSLSREELENLHALQLSDAVKHFSGVTVKDYGGVGGLKTVSVRSLGAQHTAIGYDGIAVTDCQTGQIDIGRFSLENVDRVALSNGQDNNIFQPARFFASAGILHIETLAPKFEDGKSTHFHAKVKTGSWGLANPSFRLEQKLGRKWVLAPMPNGCLRTGVIRLRFIMGTKTMHPRARNGRTRRCSPCVPKPDCTERFPSVSNGGSRLIITSLRAGFLPLLPIITIIPTSICGTRMCLCRAITGKSSTAGLPSGLPGNGTGVTSVTSTLIIKGARDRRRTIITSKNITFRLQHFGVHWITFRFPWQRTEA